MCPPVEGRGEQTHRRCVSFVSKLHVEEHLPNVLQEISKKWNSNMVKRGRGDKRRKEKRRREEKRKEKGEHVREREKRREEKRRQNRVKDKNS